MARQPQRDRVPQSPNVTRAVRLATALLLLLLALPCPLRAQEGSGVQKGAPADEQEPPRTDVYDLLKMLRHQEPPPGAEAPPPEPDSGVEFTLVPVIGANPSSGFSVGVGASVDFPLGDLHTTRVSQFNGAAVVTTRKQLRLTGTARLYGADNRWYLDGDDQYALTGIDTYALGAGAQGDPVRADYHSTRFFNTFYWQLANGLYGGIGLNYARQANIHPAEGEEEIGISHHLSSTAATTASTWTRRRPLDPPSECSSTIATAGSTRPGAGTPAPTTEPTSRISLVAPRRGRSSMWNFRTYAALTKSRTRRLAFWTYGDFVTGGTGTYLSLPSTGGDTQGRSGRGYADGQIRGERLLYGEVEYRTALALNGFIGGVVFANATTVSSRETGERLFDHVAPAAGLGLRFLLQKRSRTNLCLDYAWGRQGARGFYLGLGEAF